MQDSIFTKIIKGEIPCHKIYEDDVTLAFLDIYPMAEGHVLVIPKKQVEFVWDLEDNDYHALMNAAKKVAVRLRTTLGKKYIAERIIGTDVPHAHVHILPFNDTSELQHATGSLADNAQLAVLAEKLRFDD